MTNHTSTQTIRPLRWTITGASQGFGRALTAETLRRGHHVTAVLRDATAVADLKNEYGQRLSVVTGDLREPAAVDGVAAAIAEDRPDVLVNNAGRAIVGAAEELPLVALREQQEVNFFAAATLTTAALPAMRERGSGTVVQMSSQGGRMSFPGVGAYSASKFALEGWSEALASEVAPFGIRVMIVEPSRFRTGFNSAHSLGFVQESEVYAEVVGPVRAELAGVDGAQEGDPTRAATIIADLVDGGDLPLRLPLGAEAVRRLSNSYAHGLDEVRRWAALACSADFPDAAPSTRVV